MSQLSLYCGSSFHQHSRRGFCAGASVSACVCQFSACVEMISLCVRRTGELQAQILMHLVRNHSNAIPKQSRCLRRKIVPAQKIIFALISDFSLSWTSDVKRSYFKEFCFVFGGFKTFFLVIRSSLFVVNWWVEKNAKRECAKKTLRNVFWWKPFTTRSSDAIYPDFHFLSR